MSVPDVVSVDWLDKHKNSVVLLDAAYEMGPKPDYKEFKEKHYGKFEELMLEESNFTQNYTEHHIPGAVLFNMDVAYYPSQYIRFDLYPPKEFEKYVRLLGINSGDHVVIYSRDKFAGMMWAARVWWTFKPGNWSAKPIDKSLLITYEELDKKGASGKSLFEDLSKINYLDARPAAQFNGTDPLGIPLAEALKKAGYDGSLTTITACNGGVQASLLALAMDHVGKSYRVYNGGMYEIGLRSPKMITEK
ncbi:hypothetical protein ANCCEY_06995 [Ancylostoma ceylanicum]|uniref:Rhodanese domain-containing protein n=1 Tax=Ancylostoma ceylanicum TaxID=53326 RepID=A0A0D6LRW0_9BILA|nr:hypothetical protein ANCCEY_06995 [Ancylostoma ceylanicum]